jgi:hypothetical protein
MGKILVILSSILIMTSIEVSYAKTLKHKKKSHHTSRSRKHRRHHGNGPDLKAITKESLFTETPNNGVTSLETNGSPK